ncbi:MAG: ribbon-helix-helix domain-containing protein [Candidatus Micrarchaeota archaeon]
MEKPEKKARKFTTVAVSKEMVKHIDEIVRSSEGMYKTKAEFINSALREKVERVRENAHLHQRAKEQKHDPATM